MMNISQRFREMLGLPPDKWEYEASLARRVEFKVVVAGIDISEDMNRYFLSADYTDNEEDRADSLNITIDDRDHVWRDRWLRESVPKGGLGAEEDDGKPVPDKGNNAGLNESSGVAVKGAPIECQIIQKNWTPEFPGDDKVLSTGVLYIDSVRYQGPPNTIQIKASSMPITSASRTVTHSKTWKDVALSKVADEVAAENNMGVLFESGEDPLFDYREQYEESNVSFLKRLCYDAGLVLKVTSNQLIIFNDAEYERRPTVRNIEYGKDGVIKWDMETGVHDTVYNAAHVAYINPNTGNKIEYTYKPRGVKIGDPDVKVLEINERVKDKEEARQLAMKRMRQKNRNEQRCTIEIEGDPWLVAGVTVQLLRFGAFDSRYIVTSATHSITGNNGYKLKIALRKCIEEDEMAAEAELARLASTTAA